MVRSSSLARSRNSYSGRTSSSSGSSSPPSVKASASSSSFKSSGGAFSSSVVVLFLVWLRCEGAYCVYVFTVYLLYGVSFSFVRWCIALAGPMVWAFFVGASVYV